MNILEQLVAATRKRIMRDREKRPHFQAKLTGHLRLLLSKQRFAHLGCHLSAK